MLIFVNKQKKGGMKMDRGIVRNIDDLGRVVIPKEFRKILSFKESEPIEIFCEDDFVKIKKFSENTCIICCSDEDLIEFKNTYICNRCKKELKKELKNAK